MRNEELGMRNEMLEDDAPSFKFQGSCCKLGAGLLEVGGGAKGVKAQGSG
jgi:hypothetical protein